MPEAAPPTAPPSRANQGRNWSWPTSAVTAMSEDRVVLRPPRYHRQRYSWPVVLSRAEGTASGPPVAAAPRLTMGDLLQALRPRGSVPTGQDRQRRHLGGFSTRASPTPVLPVTSRRPAFSRPPRTTTAARTTSTTGITTLCWVRRPDFRLQILNIHM